LENIDIYFDEFLIKSFSICIKKWRRNWLLCTIKMLQFGIIMLVMIYDELSVYTALLSHYLSLLISDFNQVWILRIPEQTDIFLNSNWWRFEINTQKIWKKHWSPSFRISRLRKAKIWVKTISKYVRALFSKIDFSSH